MSHKFKKWLKYSSLGLTVIGAIIGAHYWADSYRAKNAQSTIILEPENFTFFSKRFMWNDQAHALHLFFNVQNIITSAKIINIKSKQSFNVAEFIGQTKKHALNCLKHKNFVILKKS